MRGERVVINAQTLLVMEICITCSAPFGVLETFQSQRKRDGNSFYCPMGHPQIYRDTYKDRIDDAKKETANFRELLRLERIKSKQLSDDILDKTQDMQRLQKRVANGVCPHCHRTFAQLARHMKSQHP